MGSPSRPTTFADQASSQRLIDRLAYTYEEAAQLLGVSPRTAWGLCSEGKLRAVRVGKRSVRIPRAEIERFLSAATLASEAKNV